MDVQALIILSFTVIAIISLVSLIVLSMKMSDNSSSIPTPPTPKHPSHPKLTKLTGAYLNSASTNAKLTGQLNPSDLSYPQVMSDRLELEDFFINVKRLVNAPPYAEVIINSGATESIATCVNWAKNINPYGTVVGSEYDHSAIADACAEYQLEYSPSLRSSVLNDKTSAVFLTQVDSKTGEIINIDNFKMNVMNRYHFLTEEPNASGRILQHRPLVFIDATQSITKVPIDMDKWEADAIFFSLHKIGGPIGVGLLVIDQSRYKFKPLIPGKQQKGLRGGTYPLEQVLDAGWVLDQQDNRNTRKDKWNDAFQKLTAAGLKVHRPRGEHLYNTFLIDIGRCPLGSINKLAQQGIYIGNSSACQNEQENPANNSSGSVRLSFTDPDDLSDEVLDRVIKELLATPPTPQPVGRTGHAQHLNKTTVVDT